MLEIVGRGRASCVASKLKVLSLARVDRTPLVNFILRHSGSFHVEDCTIVQIFKQNNAVALVTRKLKILHEQILQPERDHTVHIGELAPSHLQVSNDQLLGLRGQIILLKREQLGHCIGG